MRCRPVSCAKSETERDGILPNPVGQIADMGFRSIINLHRATALGINPEGATGEFGLNFVAERRTAEARSG